MVQPFRSKRLNFPVAPVIGGALGLITSGVFALVPTFMLEAVVSRSGIPAILSAAEPPLGLTARLVLILLCGSGVGLVSWFACFVAVGSRRIVMGSNQPPATAASSVDGGSLGDDLSVPVLRRADAHPDAPARRPLFANRDLGPPFLNVRATAAVEESPAAAEVAVPVKIVPESFDVPIMPLAALPVTAQDVPPLPLRREPIDIPANLDQPMARFDPAAIPAFPATPIRPVAPLSRPQLVDPVDRFETFELTPIVRPEQQTPDPVIAERTTVRDNQATIAALLQRLERGVTHRSDHLALTPALTPIPAPAPALTPTPAQSPPLPAIPVSSSLQETLGRLRQMAIRT